MNVHKFSYYIKYVTGWGSLREKEKETEGERTREREKEGEVGKARVKGCKRERERVGARA